ncbi:hypothetical protein KFK09_026721 [Dendrobium nobile]|uniref:Uncharacterized protein n=1 Tax=Dendrobium nobile TaxID=94219 RepID=A0A8T3A8I7_DENNO|nr:hypothetical protein KFK09_026721 [Dendrobium nobile]
MVRRSDGVRWWSGGGSAKLRRWSRRLRRFKMFQISSIEFCNNFCRSKYYKVNLLLTGAFSITLLDHRYVLIKLSNDLDYGKDRVLCRLLI